MMDVLFLARLLNGLLMCLLPVGLGLYLNHRFNMGWRLWWIGMATFILSQVGHISFNIAVTSFFRRGWLPNPPETWQPLFFAIFLGLSAGLWEELARYATYRWWAKDARSWSKALMLGAGHGGIEAILLGLLVFLTFVNMVTIRNADLSTFIPAEQLPLAEQQVNLYWSLPWFAALLGALERIFALPFHLAASVLVLQVFTRQQNRWLWLAIVWHAILDAVAYYIYLARGPYIAELWLGILTLANLAIIFALRQPEPEPAESSELPPLPLKPVPLSLPDLEESPENLDKTRYN